MQQAYADLVATRAPALLRLALMLTGNLPDAEDLLQSTLVRTQRHAARIERMAAPASYLRTALVHEHLSLARMRGRRPRTTPLDGHDVPIEPPGLPEDRAWRLLATLPRKQRAVLALRYYEDLSDAEIASVLRCGESTVRSNAARALATLRAALAETQEVHP